MKKNLSLLVIISLAIGGVIFGVFQNSAWATTNLLTNPDFNGSTGWTIIENGGSGAVFNGEVYATSYAWNSISQTVDLVAAGYTAEQLDAAPDIAFSIFTFQRFDHDGQYYLEYKLLAENGSTVLASQTYGSAGSPIYLSANTPGFDTPYIFSDYGTGVRYAYIKIAGRDGSPDWGGQYGPYFYNPSISFPDSTGPTIDDLSPTDNAIDVAVDSNLIITFDEAVDVETGDIVIYDSDDSNSIFETIDVTSGQVTGTGTDTITIDPSTNLRSQTNYYILIDATAFDDTAGNSYTGIADSMTWNFTTIRTHRASPPAELFATPPPIVQEIVTPPTVEDQTANPDTTNNDQSTTTTGEQQTLETFTTSRLIKMINHNAVYYLTDDGQRRPFLNDEVFLSRYPDFSNVVEMTTSEIAQYNLGPIITYGSSFLIKFQSSPKVYLVSDENILRWIIDEQTFHQLGYNFYQARELPDSLMTVYQLGADIK